jgi:hypothetical protein
VTAFSDLGTNFGPSTSGRFSLRLGNLRFCAAYGGSGHRSASSAGATVGRSESPGRPTYNHPRSHGPNKKLVSDGGFEVAKRAVGIMVLLLAVVLLLMPVPLTNVAPAMVISLISLAYVEEDGLLLSAAFLAAIILIGIGSAAVWGAIVGAALISS